MISFAVYGHPQPAGSKKGFVNPKSGAVIITDASTKARPWKALVSDAAVKAMATLDGGHLLAGPLVLQLTFFTPRPKAHYGTGRNEGLVKASAPPYPASKPDLLKLARAIEDALTGVVYRDDAQIVREHLRKHYGEPARVEVVVMRA